MNLLRRRLAADREAGFTLIELLVVMLILGILASIAMPAFFNQKNKANDAKAKEMAHAVQVAMETCNVSNGGTYSTSGCTLSSLQAIEPTIPATGVVVEPNVPASGYTIKVTATASSNVYIVKRETTGAVVFKCTVASSNRGGCPGTGTAEGSWASG
jgi:type IV pilus assembly protein PilA